MIRLKKRYWILLIVLLLGLFGWRYWHSFKQQQGIAIDWQGVNIGFDGISFDELSFSKQSLLTVTGKNLSISWSNWSASSLDIHWQSGTENPVVTPAITAENKTENQTDFDLSSLSTIIYWLPKTIHVGALRFYEQESELFNIKADMTKDQQTVQIVAETNEKYSAQLSATLAFNAADSRIDVQTACLTTTINQPDITNGQVTIPFTGWIKTDQLSLTSLENATISADKITLSPELLLTEATGNAKLQIDSKIPFDSKQFTATAQLTVSKLNGIYNRSEIKSVTGNSTITIKDDNLTVVMPTLSIQEIDVGVPFQKIKLSGNYTAPLSALDTGIATWTQAQADIFSGQLLIEKGKVNLAKLPQQLNVKLKQIQLSNIFSAYPVEGLAGDGIIEGTLPITLTMTKKNNKNQMSVVIKNGTLSTVNTGFLQFNSAALKNYAQSNPSMQIVTDVLNNFHYNVLKGTVDYQNEIAHLGLNIQGRNPEVQNGKAVNLNMTVEENIPKLMMSLQLSDQISDPIRKRIEERLK